MTPAGIGGRVRPVSFPPLPHKMLYGPRRVGRKGVGGGGRQIHEGAGAWRLCSEGTWHGACKLCSSGSQRHPTVAPYLVYPRHDRLFLPLRPPRNPLLCRRSLPSRWRSSRGMWSTTATPPSPSRGPRASAGAGAAAGDPGREGGFEGWLWDSGPKHGSCACHPGAQAAVLICTSSGRDNSVPDTQHCHPLRYR